MFVHPTARVHALQLGLQPTVACVIVSDHLPRSHLDRTLPEGHSLKEPFIWCSRPVYDRERLVPDFVQLRLRRKAFALAAALADAALEGGGAVAARLAAALARRELLHRLRRGAGGEEEHRVVGGRHADVRVVVLGVLGRRGGRGAAGAARTTVGRNLLEQFRGIQQASTRCRSPPLLPLSDPMTMAK